MTYLSLAGSMVVEPDRVFAGEEFKRRSAVTILLSIEILAPVVLLAIYYNVVNFPWLVDQFAASVPAEQRDAVKKSLTPGILTGVSTVTLAVSVVAITLLLSAYFFVIAKIQGSAQTFGGWFAMTVWASLPSLLLLPVGIVALLLTQNGQLNPSALNAVSLNELFFHLSPDSGWAGLLDSLGLTLFWSIGLMGIGYARLAGVHLSRGILVACIPYLLVFGTWAVIVLATAQS